MDSSPAHGVISDDALTIEILVAEGADVNIMNDLNGFTPLHSAAYYGNAVTIDVLLSKGAHAEEREDNGLTPLHLATMPIPNPMKPLRCSLQMALICVLWTSTASLRCKRLPKCMVRRQ